MAKKITKTTKKSTTPKRAAAKAVLKKKPSAAKPAPKPASRAAASRGPVPVSTGKGLTALQIGQDLVAKFNAGKMELDQIGHFAPELVSCEGLGVGLEWRGREAVDAKNADWMSSHTMHGASAEGPYVGSTGFAVKFSMDVEIKATGQRIQMNEIGVYSVRDGKIVREEFMYAGPKS